MSPTTPRLLTLVAVLAVGAALGLQGLHAHRAPVVALSGSGGSAGAAGSSSASRPASNGSSGSGASAQGSSSTAASSGSSGTSSSSGATASKGHGTLLSSTQVAPFTYEVYPSPVSQLAQAESGFNVTIQSGQSGGKTLSVANSSGGSLLKRSFVSTDHVYWVETSYGDDAPGQDANYGDDAYILTDPQGYITQK